MDSDRLDEFLNRVLTASNAHELGGGVLDVLQQWKNEIEVGVEPDVKFEESEIKVKSEESKEEP